MSAKIEDLDWRIIAVLQENGRTSNREVARQLGISEATVRSRLKRLETAGVIRIRAVGDVNRASGLGASAMLGIDVHPGRIDEVVAKILEIATVTIAFTTVGRHDVIAFVTANDQNALTELVLDRIATIPGVESTATYQAATVIKHDFRWVRITE